jgi:hypothetical protein
MVTVVSVLLKLIDIIDLLLLYWKLLKAVASVLKGVRTVSGQAYS